MERFDATITVGRHHLAVAGVAFEKREAVAGAVRAAVERLTGAGSIDVSVQGYPPECPGWVIVHPQGRANTPDTPEWRTQRLLVEGAVRGALIALATPR